ncbi:hypothetical protein AbraCBS73388_004988 [Aspergillus brasiliensis]|uniref:Dipeptidylpeptidase IV N-terminal domain-containing protein n=1 Tax=Aspergillus brasiliensis TaxID=319629 RepID=A0A9W5Z4J7_9EURO|nr:hypothetical protein AbraCBS73388_004988 [Aspergillus brasiliensis]
MDGTEVLSYGLWKSPVTADLLSQQSSIGSIRINESQRKIYAVQTGPDHPAQLVAISCPGSTPHAEDLLPSPYSVGTQVYEYGGGAFAVSRDGRRIVFSDSSTGSVCILDPLDRSVRKCIEQLNRRYADFDIHPVYPHWVCAVEEDISALNHSTTSHALVLLDTASGEVVKLEDQDDFYSQMRFSPDGHQICWLAWSHPHMHFTGAVLYVGKIEQGRLVSKERIGGIPGREAIAQPRWSPAGRLHFLRDRSGFWHLCVYHAQSAESLEIAISGIEHCDMGNPDFGLGRYEELACSHIFDAH